MPNNWFKSPANSQICLLLGSDERITERKHRGNPGSLLHERLLQRQFFFFFHRSPKTRRLDIILYRITARNIDYGGFKSGSRQKLCQAPHPVVCVWGSLCAMFWGIRITPSCSIKGLQQPPFFLACPVTKWATSACNAVGKGAQNPSKVLSLSWKLCEIVTSMQNITKLQKQTRVPPVWLFFSSW